jgi:hypothetical protein
VVVRERHQVDTARAEASHVAQDGLRTGNRRADQRSIEPHRVIEGKADALGDIA